MAKILVVDNDAGITTLYRDILKHEGFEVFVADNGRDGLDLAVKKNPNLILLDVMMPQVDGAETARSLLENEKTKKIPIIFLTSAVTEEEALKSSGNIGGRTYISKSMKRADFIKIIRQALLTHG